MYSRLAPKILPVSLSQAKSFPGLWLKFTIAGTVAIGISYLSRRYFEEPFLRLKDKFT